MKSKQGIKTGIILGLALLLFGSCKEEEMYTIQEFTKLACTFHDKSIPNGQSVIAYSAESLVYDAKCSSVAETRTCNDGELSGTFEFNSCVEEPPATCTFDNKTVAHDGFVTAYSSSLREWNESCGDVQAVRTCDNGTLSNTSHIYPTCAVKSPDNCTFNGQLVLHDGVVEAYTTSLTDYPIKCGEIVRNMECTNGVFDLNTSTYAYSSCEDGIPDNCSLDGKFVVHTESFSFANTRTVAYGQNCQTASRTCDDGVLSGDSNYKYASCSGTDPVACNFADGGQLAHGSSQPKVYNAAKSDWPNLCDSAAHVAYNVSCTNGNFSSPFANNSNYSSCVNDQPDNCTLKDNVTGNPIIVAHNDNVTAYSQKTVSFDQECSNFSSTVACYNGVLTPSGYTWNGCSPGPPASCSFNSTTKAHGASFNAFSTNLIDWNASKVGLTDPADICSDNLSTLTCNNGLVSGVDNLTHTFATCSMKAPVSCNLDGKPVNHLGTVTAYKYNSSGNGSCSDSIIRTCTNGSFDGDSSYQYDNCLNEVVLVGARGTGVSQVELTWIPLDNESNYYEEYFAPTNTVSKIKNSEVEIKITQADGANIGPHTVSIGAVSDISASGTFSVFVIIDDSSTMITNDPTDLRYDAVNELINVLPTGTDLRIADYTGINNFLETIDYIVKDASLSDKGARQSEVNSNKRSNHPETPLWYAMYKAAFNIVTKQRILLITLSDGKNNDGTNSTNNLAARGVLNSKKAEIHNIGLFSGADPIDLEFKQMPNNSQVVGGSYREVTNAADLTNLFTNLGKTTSIGYGKGTGSVSGFPGFQSGTTYTGTITIRNIRHTFTFTY